MTPDQQSLVELADEILRARTTPELLAATETSDSRVDERLWTDLASAGLVGIGVPEHYGGAGLGLTEICLLLEVAGRRVAPVPLWETTIAARAVARSGGHAVLRGVVDGNVRLGLGLDLGATGVRPLVCDGVGASVAVLEDGADLVAADLMLADRVPVDTTTHALAADVDVATSRPARIGGPEDVTLARAEARLGLSALMLGLADEGIREAAAYLSQREQFGRPLATFQAVSQQLGDAYCDVQAMRATLWQAVWALEQGGDARREVDVATWWACDAGLRVQTAVQHLHGGIGADTTYPVHRRLLWALQTDALLGGASRQLARLGSALV